MYDPSPALYGSARWAEHGEVRRAGLLNARGSLHLGYWKNRRLTLESDAPGLIVGGAGAGKLSTLLGHTAITSPERCVFADPKGEIAAISILAQTRMGKAAYVINPHRLHSHVLPAHTVNLLSFLKPGALSLTSDVKSVCKELIASSGGGDARFFEQRGRAWLETFIKYDVVKHGCANLPRIARYVTTITQSMNAWTALAADIAVTADELETVVTEITAFQAKGNRAFEGILGEINNGLAFLTDPALQNTMAEDNPDFSFEYLCDPKQDANCYIVVPGDALDIWAPFVRLIFGAISIVKSRRPDAPRINFIIDEAGQLGKADFLKRAYTLNRGAGIRTTAVFQDIGQIRENFGPQAVTTFIGSAQVRQFIGTRDFETAKLISDMLGMETHEWIDPVKASQHELARKKALTGILQGAEPLEAVLEARHHQIASIAPQRHARALMTPSEVLSLPENQQILFVSGVNCPPLLANRKPYFQERCYNGWHLANPFHPPSDKISLPTRWGRRWRRIVRESVPARFAYLPQHRDGLWSYVEGFRPKC